MNKLDFKEHYGVVYSDVNAFILSKTRLHIVCSCDILNCNEEASSRLETFTGRPSVLFLCEKHTVLCMQNKRIYVLLRVGTPFKLIKAANAEIE